MAEEVEDIRKSDLRSLGSYLSIIVAHLLKWQYQLERRGSNWEKSIRVHRINAKKKLANNPGLKSVSPEIEDEINGDALVQAVDGLGEQPSCLPDECHYTIE